MTQGEVLDNPGFSVPDAKLVLIAIDADSIPVEEEIVIHKFLLKKGVLAVFIRILNYNAKINVFDLSNVPAVDIEEIRKMVSRYATEAPL